MTDNGRRSRTPPGAATIFDPYMLMNGPNKKISNRLALYFAAAFLSVQELPAQQPAERAVPLAGIHIRDPYILPVAGDSTYYLFGTNQADVSYRSKGFYCYASRDLKEWTGPYLAFVPDEGFWGGNNFWAAECPCLSGQILSVRDDTRQGRQPARHGHIRGRHAERTLQGTQQRARHAEDWNSLDGTLHVDRQGRPWMVFCHEWTQIGNGTVEAVRLKKDLSGPAGKPVTLFKASEAPWVRSHVPGEKLYVTDGPFLLRNSRGELLMLWSSFTDEGYAIGLARSRSGDIGGPWEQFPQPIFRRDGGHGMILRTFDGRLLLSIHQPNRTPDERTKLFPLRETADGGLEIAGDALP